MKWNSLIVCAGLLLSFMLVFVVVRLFRKNEPVVVEIQPTLPFSETFHREKLTTKQAEWWQPLTSSIGADGGRNMTFASDAASDEFDRREAEAYEALRLAAPDDAFYVFDDEADASGVEPYTHQNIGFKNKLGVDKWIAENHVELMPAFDFIATDNPARVASLTGGALAAYNACTPIFWDVSIQSLLPNNSNGFDVEVSATAGHRKNGPGAFGEACFLHEKWSVSADGNSATLLERTVIQETNFSF